MGSGLILLVIVGAWLVVLVPMVLRSHESTAAQNTVDKFHDAMRVLSRRHAPPDADEAADSQPEDEAVALPATSRRLARAEATGSAAARPATARPLPAPESTPPSPAMSAAARRRILLALLLAVLLTLIGALMGPVWLWGPQVVVDLVLVAFVVHLRATTLRIQRERRAARERARAAAMRRAARPPRTVPATVPATGPAAGPGASPAGVRAAAPAPRPARPAAGQTRSPGIVVRPPRPMRVAGVPDRMPSSYEVIGRPLPERPVVAEEVAEAPARGAQGAAWLPVPVPPPIYLSAPSAKPRTQSRSSAERSDGVAAAERSLGIDDQGPELGQILKRRTAVND